MRSQRKNTLHCWRGWGGRKSNNLKEGLRTDRGAGAKKGLKKGWSRGGGVDRAFLECSRTKESYRRSGKEKTHGRESRSVGQFPIVIQEKGGKGPKPLIREKLSIRVGGGGKEFPTCRGLTLRSGQKRKKFDPQEHLDGGKKKKGKSVSGTRKESDAINKARRSVRKGLAHDAPIRG